MDSYRQNDENYPLSTPNGLISDHKYNHNNSNNFHPRPTVNRGDKRPWEEDENEQEAQKCFKRLRIDNNYHNYDIGDCTPNQTNQLITANNFERVDEGKIHYGRNLQIQQDQQNSYAQQQRTMRINGSTDTVNSLPTKYTNANLSDFSNLRQDTSMSNANTEQYRNMNSLLGKLHEDRIRRSQETQESFQNRQINSHHNGMNYNHRPNQNLLQNYRQQQQQQRNARRHPNQPIQQRRPIIYLPSHSRLF